MSKAPAASKQSSRWGSFLQQAVAGVESRLDTILADGDEAPPASKKLDYKGQPSAREALALQGPAKSRADSRVYQSEFLRPRH